MDDGGIYSAIAAYEAQIERQEEKIEKIDAVLPTIRETSNSISFQELILANLVTNADWQGENYEEYCSAFEEGLKSEQETYLNEVYAFITSLEEERGECQRLIEEYRGAIAALRKRAAEMRKRS